MHFSDLVREFEYAPTTVRYHLTVLERERVVSALAIGHYLRYYPREPGDVFRRDVLSPEEKRTLAVLRQRVPLGVAAELLTGERTHGSLAAAVAVSPSTLTHHLQRMLAAGVVALRKEGRETRVTLVQPDLVRRLFAQYRPAPDLADALVDLFEDL